jgi:glycine/D-amino acid oxidase-like deaminating enzyme
MPFRAQADPWKATRAFASAAEWRGAHILLSHEVTGIQSQSDDPYRVKTSQGSYQAATLVIAAGAWCGGIGAMLSLRIPIVPVRGQIWASDPLPPRLFHTIRICWRRQSWLDVSPRSHRSSPSSPSLGARMELSGRSGGTCSTGKCRRPACRSETERMSGERLEGDVLRHEGS